MKNKCEELNMAHAWRKTTEMYEFHSSDKETCANCGLSRTYWYTRKEGYSYSDGRPDEEIHNIRPV